MTITPTQLAEWKALDEPTEAMIEAAAAAHFLRMYPHSVTKWRSLSKRSFVRSTHIEAAERCLLVALEVSAAREAVPALIAEVERLSALPDDKKATKIVGHLLRYAEHYAHLSDTSTFAAEDAAALISAQAAELQAGAEAMHNARVLLNALTGPDDAIAAATIAELDKCLSRRAGT